MKLMSEICQEMLTSFEGPKTVLCDYIMTPQGAIRQTQPILATEHCCAYCQSRNYFTPYVDPKISDDRMWLCANERCDVYRLKTMGGATTTQVTPKRGLEWPLFCEINGIGDLHHGVKFEDIEQSRGKIDFLHKFATNPKGVVLMQGTPGAGKTFAAMGVCELFTRANPAALFTTQKQMLKNWQNKTQDGIPYEDRVSKVNLLVIDDFGTAEISPGFMSFFMDVLNSRLQWSNRGTIITTNLSDKDFTAFCGAALNDRIQTGQKLVFANKSRRKEMIL